MIGRSQIFRLTSIVFLLLMTGCSSGKVKLEKSFWSNNSMKIGIAVKTSPQGGAYREGGEGLLDMAINSATSSGIQKFLANFDVSKFTAIQDSFASSLKKAGFTSKKLSYPFDVDQFEEFEKPDKASGHFAKYDFSSLSSKEDIDLLLLVTINRFGTNRNYWGFVPMGAPRAIFYVTGELFRLKDHQVLWLETLGSEMGINGDWDQEPNYPNVTKAIHAAMEKASNDLVLNFTKSEYLRSNFVSVVVKI